MNWRAAGVGLLVLGLLLVAHSLYAWPHHGETEHVVFVEPAETAPPGATVVAAEDLPPEARGAVENGGAGGLWSGEDAAAVAALREADYVRHEGTLYRVDLGHVDHFRGPFRPLTTILAGLLLGIGGLLAWEHEPRPRSPLAAAWVPLAVILALQTVETLDAGRIPVLNVGMNMLGLSALVAPLGLGVAIRRRATASAVSLTAAVLVAGAWWGVTTVHDARAYVLWAGLMLAVGTIGFIVAAPQVGERSPRQWLADVFGERAPW